MRIGAMLCAVLPLAMGGCAMSKVTVDSSRLAAATSAPVGHLACEYRLGELVDARPAGGSGRAGNKGFEVQDAMGIVRTQLAAAGLDANGSGRKVDIRLMQLYLAQNTITLVPVVVYEAKVEGREAVVLRGAPASMNGWNSDDETIRAYGAALHEANEKLVRSLNQACPTGA